MRYSEARDACPLLAFSKNEKVLHQETARKDTPALRRESPSMHSEKPCCRYYHPPGISLVQSYSLNLEADSTFL